MTLFTFTDALIFLVLLVCTAAVIVVCAKIIIDCFFKRKRSINMNTKKVKLKNVKLVAHRGLSGIERENTYPAFTAAANRSYYGIETDVHKTADGRFVVIHDEDTERVSLGKVKAEIAKSTAEQLSDIVLPDLDGSTGRLDIRIPFLKDYIKICKKYGKVCILELKIPFSAEDLKNIVGEIKAQNYLENVVFISFFLDNCIMMRNILPDNDVQWLINGKVTDEVIKTLIENKLDLDIYYRSLNRESVKKLHTHGIKVNCWTCDIKFDAEKLVNMGVDFITTNILESV